MSYNSLQLVLPRFHDLQVMEKSYCLFCRMFLGGLQSVLPAHAIHYRIARTTEAVLADIFRLPPRCGLTSNYFDHFFFNALVAFSYN